MNASNAIGMKSHTKQLNLYIAVQADIKQMHSGICDIAEMANMCILVRGDPTKMHLIFRILQKHSHAVLSTIIIYL